MAKDIPTHYYNQKHSDRGKVEKKWWLTKPDEMYMHAHATFSHIAEKQSYKYQAYLQFARMYTNQELQNLRSGPHNRQNFQRVQNNRVTYNVVKACTDTATSKIGTKKPRPQYLTSDGSWELQERAENLSSYMLALFEQIGTGFGEDKTLYGIGTQVFRDSCIFGTGAAKFFKDGDKIKAERIIIDEIVVDDAESLYRQPRSLFQHKLMDRHVLCDLFPHKKKEILAASSGLDTEMYNQSSADMLQVIEGWHLPSGEDASDGVRMVFIENATLHVEKYTKPYFPFLFLRWTPAPLGFDGIGLAEELRGIQLDINKTLRVIQIAQHLIAVPQVWLDIQSKTVTKRISNEIGAINYYSGSRPYHVVPQAMSGEMYQHVERQFQRAFEITGISVMSATSRKPSGLDSAVALREYKDTETERFAAVERDYENFYMDASRMCLDMLRDLKKEGTNVVVRGKEGSYMKALKFSDVDIPDDKMTVRVYPTNMLPTTPAGKLQKVQELMQAGMFTPDQGFELLDFPDVKKTSKLKTASKDAVVKTIEHIIKSGDYLPPEPYMPLELAKEAAQSYYLLGRAESLDEDRLELLRRFLDDIDALLNPEPEMPMPGMMPGGMAGMGLEDQAMAIPEAPPESELLPNVPQ